MNAKNLDRRNFITTLGMCAGGLATFSLPSLSFAKVQENKRLVFVLLRGGFDGLAAVAPTFDPAYHKTRGKLAVNPGDLINLSKGFALSPGLAPLMDFWKRDEMAVLHAMAIPYRTRSHFDGQAVLETGLDKPVGSSDGWMNRLLKIMGGKNSGIAVAAGMPKSMSGDVEVSSWSPAELGSVDENYLDQLHLLYRSDPKLANRFEAALGQREISGDMEGMSSRGGRRNRDMGPIFKAAAKFLKAENGPNVAALEMSGWDTHVNQGLVGGSLDNLLGRLASGLTVFHQEMADQWPGTTVIVMTEFGREAKPNGSGGTDHGTAGAGFVLGTDVGKSKIVTEWPGLNDRELFQGRDLAPTTDTRAVLKSVLAGSFDLTKDQLNRVFPGSSNVNGLWKVMSS